jgi:hypothetical protein
MQTTRSRKALAAAGLAAGLAFVGASAAWADEAVIALPGGSPFPESLTATADGTLSVSRRAGEAARVAARLLSKRASRAVLTWSHDATA